MRKSYLTAVKAMEPATTGREENMEIVISWTFSKNNKHDFMLNFTKNVIIG